MDKIFINNSAMEGHKIWEKQVLDFLDMSYDLIDGSK